MFVKLKTQTGALFSPLRGVKSQQQWAGKKRTTHQLGTSTTENDSNSITWQQQCQKL